MNLKITYNPELIDGKRYFWKNKFNTGGPHCSEGYGYWNGYENCFTDRPGDDGGWKYTATSWVLIEPELIEDDYTNDLENIIKEGVENGYAVQEIVLAVSRLNQRCEKQGAEK